MNRTIYLAGSIYGSSYNDAMYWRVDVEQELKSNGWRCLNPLNGEPHDFMNKSLPMCNPDVHSLTNQAIAGKDYYYIQQSSIIIANMLVRPEGYPMVGTTLEIGYAIALNKLIYVVSEPDSYWAKHPLITAKCVVVPTLEIAVEIIKSL